MPVLHLRVLGSFRAELASGSLLVIATRKAQALLAFLALPPGRQHTRQALTTLLWGETAEKQAQQSFRQALARLRHALNTGGPELFVLEGPTVALAPGAVEADALTLEQLVRAGGPEALARACDLYRGDLLEGFDFGEPAFDDWLALERQRLRELAVRALSQLLEHRIAAGGVEAASDTAVKLLALDPLQESAHRALMRLMLAQGRRGAALQQYQRCVETLRRELRTEPDAETQALYQEIVLEHPAPLGNAVGASMLSTSTGADFPLIGRTHELTILREQRERVRPGRPAATVILGEAGVGKSRLIDAFAAEWRRAGGRVLSGQFYETQQGLPLQGWVDALRGAGITEDLALLASLTPEQLAELERLLPMLRHGRRRRTVRRDDHVRLFQALTDLLAHIASSQPLLLALDDLQWADAMSLSLLAHVFRRWNGGSLLILGAARDEDFTDVSTLRVALHEMERARGLVSLPIAPLDRRDATDLVTAIAGPGLAGEQLAGLADDVWRVSEGNPFVIIETMRAWEPRGASREALPRAVRQMVLTRLERLSDRARDVTATAAAIGRQFSFELLQHASGLGRFHTAAALEELVRRGWLEGTADDFRFTHERLRVIVYETLLGPRRAGLHAAVAEAMELLSREMRDDFLERLPDHWSKAGDEKRAVEYLLRLAEEASERYAVDEAIRLLKEALARAGTLAVGPKERLRLDAAFRLAQALFCAGRPRETVDLLLGEEATAGQAKDPVLTARYHVWLGQAYGFLDEPGLAMRHADLALRAVPRNDDPLATGIAHFVLARSCNRLGRAGDGIEHARTAIALLETVDEPTWLGYAYWSLGLNLGHLGRWNETLQLMARVQEIADETADARLQAYAAWTSSWSYIALCDHASAIAACRRAVEIAPDTVHRATALTYLGAALVEDHAIEESIKVLEDALRLLDQFEGFAYLKAYASLNLSMAYLDAGELDRAHARAMVALECATRANWTMCIGRVQRVLGLIVAARGDTGDGQRLLREAIATLQSVGAQTELGVSEMVLAEMVVATDPREAIELVSHAHARFRALGLDAFALKAEALSRAWSPPDSLAVR